MKKIVFLLLLLSAASITAQFNQRGGRGGRIGQPLTNNRLNNRPPEFQPLKAIGLTIYDIEKTTKKIRLKKSAGNYKKVYNTLWAFNKEMKQIAQLNSFLFSEEKKKVDAAQNAAAQNRNFAAVQKAYKDASKAFEPVTAVVKEKEEELDEKLKELLSKKQFGKWRKYKLGLKKY